MRDQLAVQPNLLVTTMTAYQHAGSVMEMETATMSQMKRDVSQPFLECPLVQQKNSAAQMGTVYWGIGDVMAKMIALMDLTSKDVVSFTNVHLRCTKKHIVQKFLFKFGGKFE